MIPRTAAGRPDLGRALDEQEARLDALLDRWPLGAAEAAIAAHEAWLARRAPVPVPARGGEPR